MGPVTTGLLIIAALWGFVALVIWVASRLGADATVQRIVRVVFIAVGVVVTAVILLRMADVPLRLP